LPCIETWDKESHAASPIQLNAPTSAPSCDVGTGILASLKSAALYCLDPCRMKRYGHVPIAVHYEKIMQLSRRDRSIGQNPIKTELVIGRGKRVNFL
jgi:hypothetical protein